MIIHHMFVYAVKLEIWWKGRKVDKENENNDFTMNIEKYVRKIKTKKQMFKKKNDELFEFVWSQCSS